MLIAPATKAAIEAEPERTILDIARGNRIFSRQMAALGAARSGRGPVRCRRLRDDHHGLVLDGLEDPEDGSSRLTWDCFPEIPPLLAVRLQ